MLRIVLAMRRLGFGAAAIAAAHAIDEAAVRWHLARFGSLPADSDWTDGAIDFALALLADGHAVADAAALLGVPEPALARLLRGLGVDAPPDPRPHGEPDPAPAESGPADGFLRALAAERRGRAIPRAAAGPHLPPRLLPREWALL